MRSFPAFLLVLVSTILSANAANTNYYWKSSSSGRWVTDNLWEGNVAPSLKGAGNNFYFIRNQGTLGGTVYLDASQAFAGNMVIGSESATALGGFHVIRGNQIRFDNTGSGSQISTLTHGANAHEGDTIASNITLANDLVISLLSSNALLITGTIISETKNVTMQGGGNISFAPSNSALGNAISLNTLTITSNTSATLSNTLPGTTGISAGSFIMNSSASLNVTSSSTGGNGIYLHNPDGTSIISGIGTFIEVVATAGNAIFNNSNLVIRDGALFRASVSSSNPNNAVLNIGNILVSGANPFFYARDAGNALLNTGSSALFTLENGAVLGTVVEGGGNAIINTDAAVFAIRQGSSVNFHGEPSGCTLENNNALLIVDGTLGSSGGGSSTINNTGYGVIAGNGIINNSTVNIASLYGRISPGSWIGNLSDEGSQIGTLTLNAGQSWTNGFVLEWQMGSTTDTSTAANDLLKINGTLTLDSSAPDEYHTIYIKGADGLSGGIASGTTWNLIEATGITLSGGGVLSDFIASWNQNNYFQSSAAELIHQLGLSGQGDFTLQLDGTGNIIQLVYQALSNSFIWNANTSGAWFTSGNWEGNSAPNAAGSQVYFIQEQSPGNGTADLMGGSATLGELHIGGDILTSTEKILISNGTLIFDNDGSDGHIYQYASPEESDEISANIQLLDDIVIATESPQPLLISGNITATTQNLTFTGYIGGSILTGTSNIGTGNIEVDGGNLYLLGDGSLTTTGNTTVSAGATIGGNGTLNATLVRMLASSSAINVTDRRGAKYRDQFKINGNLIASNGFTLNLDVNLADVHVTANQTGGGKPGEINQLLNSAYANQLFLAGNLYIGGDAAFTINLNDLGGGINITDWTLNKNGDSEVGFLLFTVTGGGSFNNAQWSLGNWTDDGWDLRWMDGAAGSHQLWLFYANPTRIPEPAATAAILGALSLALLIRRRLACGEEQRVKGKKQKRHSAARP